MSSPTTEDGMHSYEQVPCNIILPKDDVVPENMQPISCGPNVHPVPPVVAPTVPQGMLSTAMHRKFVKEKTQELAIVLIVTSIVQFFLGIGTLFTKVHFLLYSGIPFWGPVCMKGSLALNILGAVISCIGMIMACLDIVSITAKCGLHIGDPKPEIGDIVAFSIILITDVLLFYVSISIATFGCRSLCDVSTVPHMYLVQNGVVVPTPTSAFPAATVAFTQSSPSCATTVE